MPVLHAPIRHVRTTPALRYRSALRYRHLNVKATPALHCTLPTLQYLVLRRLIMTIIKTRLEQSFPCRPEADEGADPMAAIATAVQPGNWHRPNTEDEEDSEDFSQSAHANVAIESIYIIKGMVHLT